MRSIAEVIPEAVQGGPEPFALDEKKDYGVILFPQYVDHKASKEFAERVDGWLARPLRVLILDFQRVGKLEPTIFRPLVLLHQGIKKKGGCLFTINASHAVFQIIQQAGLDSVFSPRQSLPEALGAAGVKTARGVIDVNFLNPFVDATQSVIQSQARTPLRAGRPFVKNGRVDNEMDIAGVISMSSNAFQGSIALCFPAPVFLLIYSNMMGKPCAEITRETEDAAGELLNIIFGQAKARLNEDRNYAIREAIPTVIKGTQLSVHHTAQKPALVIPFETEAGVFHIEISADAN